MVRIPSADSQTKEGMREYVDRTFEQVGLDVEVVMVMKYNTVLEPRSLGG